MQISLAHEQTGGRLFRTEQKDQSSAAANVKPMIWMTLTILLSRPSFRPNLVNMYIGFA